MDTIPLSLINKVQGEGGIVYPRIIVYKMRRDKKFMCFNTLTGSIDLINNEKIGKNLVKGKFIELKHFPFSQLEQLFNRGYLYKNEGELKNIEDLILSKVDEIDKRMPYNFVIIPNYKCNFACKYCYEWKVRGLKDIISENEIKLIFKTIQKIIKCTSFQADKVYVTLMGGEPLLISNKNIICKILNLCALNGYEVVIITNGGTLLDYFEIMKLYRKNIRRIQVTIDGPPEIHNMRRPFKHNFRDSFTSIMKGVLKYKDIGFKIDIRVNIDKLNINYLPELMEYLVEKKILDKNVKAYIFPMSDGGCLKDCYILKEPEYFRKVLYFFKKYPAIRSLGLRFHGVSQIIKALNSIYVPLMRYCSASRNQYVLDCLGNIYKCWFGIRNPQYFSIGSFMPKFLFNKEKDDMWKERTILKIQKCKECKFSFVCGGGCPEKAWEKNKDIYHPFCNELNPLIGSFLSFIIYKHKQRIW